MPSYELVYFPIRGRGEAVRWALAGLAHGKDVDFKFSSPTNWPEDKAATLAENSNPFAQLPVLKVSEESGESFLIPESHAILLYLQRQLAPLSGRDLIRLESVVASAESLMMAYANQVYRGGHANDKELVAGLHAKANLFGPDGAIAKYERVLQQNGALSGTDKFLVGTEFSVADALLGSIIDSIQAVEPEALKGLPGVQAWYENVRSQPGLAEYLASGHEHRTRVSGTSIGHGTSL